jgi:hypothetical protein
MGARIVRWDLEGVGIVARWRVGRTEDQINARAEETAGVDDQRGRKIDCWRYKEGAEGHGGGVWLVMVRANVGLTNVERKGM